MSLPATRIKPNISAQTARIFSAMLNDLVMDATLQAHHEVARSRAVCRICNTRCGAVHTPGPSTVASQAIVPASTPGTPASAVDAKPTNGSSGTGTNTPTSVKDGNLYLECVNCSRQIASNRYAPHLSTCMGLASARRGAARGNNKSKPASEAGRSVSPASDAGANSDESPKGKGKGKTMNKRAGEEHTFLSGLLLRSTKPSDEAEFNLKRKRPGSPQVSPAKKQKQQKTSGTTNSSFGSYSHSRSTGSPVSRLRAGKDTSGPRNNTHYSPSSSQSKVPSKLRDSSTASFMGGSSTSTSSRDSSPGGISAATPASSSFSRSPHLANRAIANNKSKANAIGPPKRPSPPRPPPIHVPDYTIDVEGEETGSSTDTDSS
ncbi:hypothetical protein D9615_005184 [Tricholomella constricta]|uniref:SAGA-associated factor 11 n=1 Tax=Tricholomella constricta TaxID=117010 RepID=A0A8H5M1Z0_9AGAR|nr:hypothetical protein D9615_005184 [Tricholomella constricta]